MFITILFSADVSASSSNAPYLSLTTATAGSSSPAKILISDLLTLHMVCSPKSSTLITYHPPSETRGMTLHAHICYAGASVYWSKLYAQAADPTFVVVVMLWYALYAWDQSLKTLYVPL